MGGFTKGIILAFVAVIMLISYLAATQGWGVAPLRNPNIAKRSQQERDSLSRSGGGGGSRAGTYIYHSSGGSGFRSSGTSGIRSGGGGSTSRSFRSGSSAGRGK